MTKELMKWSGRPEICTSIALTCHACCAASTQYKSFVSEYCYVVTLKLERMTHEITHAISIILSHSMRSHNTKLTVSLSHTIYPKRARHLGEAAF